jgi:hypothetical protein
MNIILATTSDKLTIDISANANVDTFCNYMETQSNALSAAGNEPHNFTTSGSGSTLLASPASSTIRYLKNAFIANKDTANTTTVTIKWTNGTTTVVLGSFRLAPGDLLEFIDGMGWFVVSANTAALRNQSTSSVSASFASEAYLVGSAITLPSSAPQVGTEYRCRFDMTKTAAGVATPIIKVYFGTLGTTGDTALATLTFSAGTAATDTGVFEVIVNFDSVGSGTSAVVKATCRLNSQPTTGLSSLLKAVTATSAGFNSTTAGAIMGVSFNGGSSFSGTCTKVRSELVV